MGRAFHVYPEIEHSALPADVKPKKRCKIPGMQDWKGAWNTKLKDDEVVEILLETDTDSIGNVAERRGVKYQVLMQWVKGESRRKAWTRWQEIKATKRGERF